MKKIIKKEVKDKINLIKEKLKDSNELRFLLKRNDEEIIDIISGWYFEIRKFKKKYMWNEFVVEKLLKD